jgi:hypothetical protein
MSRPPHVIGPPDVIPGATRVIRPIANLNCDGARVSGISSAVVRPWTTIIGSVPRISSISSFTSACTERDRNQKQQQCRPFQSRFCSRSCGKCFRLRVFNNIRFHNNRIRIRVNFHAPAFTPTRFSLQTFLTWAANRCHDKSDTPPKDRKWSYDTLVEHRVCNFYESGDVRADHKIARVPVLGSSVPCVLVDCRHDLAEPLINFFAGPRITY